MAELPSIEEALALVLARVRRLPDETVDLGDAAGRVTAAAVRAAADLPPFPSSAMDGFAVRAADAPGTLRVVGRSAAGVPGPVELRAGEAVAIATGGVVPEGADAVVPVEVATEGDGTVTVGAVRPGENVRPRGGDVPAGAVVVPAGLVLGAAQIGAAAAAGAASIVCSARPKVAILPTGSELRPPGAALARGEIYESNAPMLAALCRSAGAEAARFAPVADDEDGTRVALEEALDADVLVTSGGVSVGQKDLVRAALRQLGAEEVFWRVAVRPGKPLAFAVRGRTLIFGLPGNPVSSLVSFELFVRPALRALQGAEPGPAYLPGRIGAQARRNEARDDLVRAAARVEPDGVWLTPLAGQESHMIARAAAAEALVLVPRGSGLLEPGAEVRYLRLD